MKSPTAETSKIQVITQLLLSGALAQEQFQSCLNQEFGELFFLIWQLYLAQELSGKEGSFITEDPARDGNNWYLYVYNNPLRFTDPTGLKGQQEDEGLSLAEERQRIANMESQLQDSSSIGAAQALESQIKEAKANYNAFVAEVLPPESAADYGGDGLSGDFEDDYVAYYQDPHPGIDITSSTDSGFESPFYLQYESSSTAQSSNPIVFSVPGTTLRMRLKHSDEEDVQALQEAGVKMYDPGTEIVPYPEKQNPGAIHFHLEVRDTEGSMVDPFGFSEGTSDEYLYNYGTHENPDWGSMNVTW